MSISSSEQSDRSAARLTRAAGPRNGYPAAAPELAPRSPIYRKSCLTIGSGTSAWRVRPGTKR